MKQTLCFFIRLMLCLTVNSSLANPTQAEIEQFTVACIETKTTRNQYMCNKIKRFKSLAQLAVKIYDADSISNMVQIIHDQIESSSYPYFFHQLACQALIQNKLNIFFSIFDNKLYDFSKKISLFSIEKDASESRSEKLSFQMLSMPQGIPYRRTVLHFIVDTGCLEDSEVTLNSIFMHNACLKHDLDSLDRDLITPLALAITQHHYLTAIQLINMGAKLTHLNRKEDTALHLICTSASYSIKNKSHVLALIKLCFEHKNYLSDLNKCDQSSGYYLSIRYLSGFNETHLDDFIGKYRHDLQRADLEEPLCTTLKDLKKTCSQRSNQVLEVLQLIVKALYDIRLSKESSIQKSSIHHKNQIEREITPSIMDSWLTKQDSWLTKQDHSTLETLITNSTCWLSETFFDGNQ